MSAARQLRHHSRKPDPRRSPLTCFPAPLPSQLRASLHPCLPASCMPQAYALPPTPSISNRYTPRLECTVTPSKQTTAVLSNRYKKPPPGGVPSRLPHRPALHPANRNTLRIEIPVTHSKQTTEAISTRYKKPPPGGVATWLPLRLTFCNSNRYTQKTEFPVTPSKQTTVVLSNRYKKPPPRGSIQLATFAPPNRPPLRILRLLCFLCLARVF
jgi:hypothetical protein